MTTKPVRVARGTLTNVLDVTVDAVPLPQAEVPTAPLRMTSQPPRFTTTTPGVMRRQPR